MFKLPRLKYQSSQSKRDSSEDEASVLSELEPDELQPESGRVCSRAGVKFIPLKLKHHTLRVKDN